MANALDEAHSSGVAGREVLSDGNGHSLMHREPAGKVLDPLTQTSAERSVMVVVTPTPATQGAAEWVFAIKLDTHSATLDDDLTKTAVLLVDGREIAPSGWSGAGPGGHHREGVLKFPASTQAPAVIELRIQRDSEPSPRVFRWDGAALR